MDGQQSEQFNKTQDDDNIEQQKKQVGGEIEYSEYNEGEEYCRSGDPSHYQVLCNEAK